eukprot:scaffold4814_cov54-Phaeocystis_antarctica.AAC.1
MPLAISINKAKFSKSRIPVNVEHCSEAVAHDLRPEHERLILGHSTARSTWSRTRGWGSTPRPNRWT